MKLSRVPGREEQVKLACNIKASTQSLLEQYHDYCEAQAGVKLIRGDLLDQMIQDFIASDKDFARAQKEGAKPAPAAAQAPAKAAAPAPVPAPVVAPEPVNRPSFSGVGLGSAQSSNT